MAEVHYQHRAVVGQAEAALAVGVLSKIAEHFGAVCAPKLET